MDPTDDFYVAQGDYTYASDSDSNNDSDSDSVRWPWEDVHAMDYHRGPFGHNLPGFQTFGGGGHVRGGGLCASQGDYRMVDGVVFEWYFVNGSYATSDTSRS